MAKKSQKKKKEQKLQRALANIQKEIQPNVYWLVKKNELSSLSKDLDFDLFSVLPDKVLRQLVTHGTYTPKTIGFKLEKN
tara:strand:- start:213 stop:452 length:240 start_codon:yes stop_codon:yes gene_type:complete